MTETEKIDLSPFYSSENFYEHWLGGMLFTDGVKFVADECQAYWLIDLIASHQPKARKKSQRLREFQIWTIRKLPNSAAMVECREDSGEPVTIRQRVPYTDFPFQRMPEDFSIYVEGNTILLPSEH